MANGETVRIESEAYAMLEKLAEDENRTLANMVSTLVKRAYSTAAIPVIGQIPFTGEVTPSRTVTANKTMIAKQGCDGIPTAACISPEEFEILTDETTRE